MYIHARRIPGISWGFLSSSSVSLLCIQIRRCLLRIFSPPSTVLQQRRSASNWQERPKAEDWSRSERPKEKGTRLIRLPLNKDSPVLCFRHGCKIKEKRGGEGGREVNQPVMYERNHRRRRVEPAEEDPPTTTEREERRREKKITVIITKCIIHAARMSLLDYY